MRKTANQPRPGTGGRPPKPETIQDARATRGQRPLDGPDGRMENAEVAARYAVEISEAYNGNFRKPTWRVLTTLVSINFALSEGGMRTPKRRRMIGAAEIADAHQPNLAPALDPVSKAGIVQAHEIGVAFRRGIERHTSVTRMQSQSRPGHLCIGAQDGKPVIATAHATREMEAHGVFCLRSAGAWVHDIESLHPRLPAARHRVMALRQDRPTTPNAGGLCIDEAVAFLGEAVGTCAAAEQAAIKFVWYCRRRYEGGAPLDMHHLRMCSAVDCKTPLFVWAKPPESGSSSNPPKFCPTCLGGGMGDDQTRRRTALRVRRHRSKRPKNM